MRLVSMYARRPQCGLPALTRLTQKRDRKSTRLNSSHSQISYAVFCLKKKKFLAMPSLKLFDRCPPCRDHNQLAARVFDICGLRIDAHPSDLAMTPAIGHAHCNSCGRT